MFKCVIFRFLVEYLDSWWIRLVNGFLYLLFLGSMLESGGVWVLIIEENELFDNELKGKVVSRLDLLNL